MADAFLDAQRLARTVLDGRAEAFELYWRQRDAETLPLHFDAVAQGTVGFNNPLNRWVIEHVGKTPRIAQRVAQLLDRKIDPADLVPMPTLLRWMAAALFRGQFDVLAEFLKSGKQVAAHAKEVNARRTLRDRAQVALSHAACERRAATWDSGETRVGASE
jgi:hypothetical protein